jgi:isoleucyl-tRNA synthetase
VKGEDLSFSVPGVELTLRQVLIPFWNSFYFLSTYAKIYDWDPSKQVHSKNSLDIWMLSLTQKLVQDVEKAMDEYDLSKAVEPLVGFVDQLTNWYIRRSRVRFWADEDSEDRRAAFSTLYTVLLTLSQVSAPFIPFLSEAVYQELRKDVMPLSVHLCTFPIYQEKLRHIELEIEMGYVQKAVSIGHSLRKEHKLKVRQPLRKAHVAASKPEIIAFLQKQKHLIMDELNVKELEFHADEGKFVRLQAKPNFRILGKKVGKLLPLLQNAMMTLSQKDLQVLAENKPLFLEVEGTKVELTFEDVNVEKIVLEGMAAGKGDEITIALDTHLTDALLLEGLSREIVNKINTMRRDLDFSVTDRIRVKIEGTDRLRLCFDTFFDYITHEVLAEKVEFGPCPEGTSWDLNGELCQITVERV